MLKARLATGLIMYLVASALLTACSPSKEDVADGVKSMFQKRLSSEEGYANLHATVSSVTLIKDQGNRYEGVATVMLDGVAHEVPVKVLADGKSVMYEAEPTALTFLLQAQIKKLFPAPAALGAPRTAPAPEAAMTDDVARLTAQWQSLNDACRGGSGDSPATGASCEAREVAYRAVRDRGWCWGHRDDTTAERRWTRCSVGDP